MSERISVNIGGVGLSRRGLLLGGLGLTGTALLDGQDRAAQIAGIRINHPDPLEASAAVGRFKRHPITQIRETLGGIMFALGLSVIAIATCESDNS